MRSEQETQEILQAEYDRHGLIESQLTVQDIATKLGHKLKTEAKTPVFPSCVPIELKPALELALAEKDFAVLRVKANERRK